MSKQNKTDIYAELRKLGKKGMLAIAQVAGGDGHTIFAPSNYKSVMPEPLLSAFTLNHASDRTPKGSIYVRGERVKSLQGIYGLTVNSAIVYALGLKESEKLGRGSRARENYETILNACR